MNRLFGVVAAGFTAMVIGAAAVPQASAAPVLTATGDLIRDTVPNATEEVRWGGRGRGWGGRGWGGRRFHHRHYGFYRPYRPVYYGGYGGYGVRCFWRPARQVWTPYGWRFRPAARICRW
jgi:hypothetical protein